MGFFDKLKESIETPSKEPQIMGPSKKKESKKFVKKDKSAPTPEPKEFKEPSPPKMEKKAQAEGQLAIDLYETDEYFVIQSTIAGVKPEDLEITFEQDMVIIRGNRPNQIEETGGKYYYQECYWGAFSRQVILPEEVDGSRAEAKMKDGVLNLRIPKIRKIQKRKIVVQQVP